MTCIRGSQKGTYPVRLQGITCCIHCIELSCSLCYDLLVAPVLYRLSNVMDIQLVLGIVNFVNNGGSIS